MDLVTKLKKLLKLKDCERANVGIIMSLIGVAIGLLILAIVLVIGPTVGYNVESSITIPSGNVWNGSSAGGAGMLNGTEIWIQDTPLLGSAAIVVIASIIISVLLGAFLMNRGRGG